MNIRVFADNCLLYRIIRSSNDTDLLQNDLNSLTDWSLKWQVSCNTSKCKLLCINTTKRNPIIHSYRLTNAFLETIKHYLYLEVELSYNLKLTNHIDNITAKANKALWFIHRNLQWNPISIKQQMYFTLVRPILDLDIQHTWNDPKKSCAVSNKHLQENQRHCDWHFEQIWMAIASTVQKRFTAGIFIDVDVDSAHWLST